MPDVPGEVVAETAGAAGPQPRQTQDRPIRWRRGLLLAALAPLGFLLQRLAAAVPEWTEQYYARGVYPYIQQTLATVSRWSPIAVGETLLLLTIATVAVRCGRGVRARWRGERSLRNLLGHAALQAAAAAGVLFLLFQLLWALNHARLPFATQIDLVMKPVETARLEATARELARRAAAVRPAAFPDGQPFLNPLWRASVADAYALVGARWPVLAGPRPPIRGAGISRLMTYSSVSGIYCPFTGEPNVNVEIPAVMLPFIACHEVAHLRGYAREDEADFIAWWVGSRAADPTLVYSAHLLAYRVTMGKLWGASMTTHMNVLKDVPAEVRADNRTIDAFWARQPKTVSKVATAISQTTNDFYLKSSGHADGVRSYGRMVDLLVAHLAP